MRTTRTARGGHFPDRGRPSYPMICMTKPDRAILAPGPAAVSTGNHLHVSIHGQYVNPWWSVYLREITEVMTVIGSVDQPSFSSRGSPARSRHLMIFNYTSYIVVSNKRETSTFLTRKPLHHSNASGVSLFFDSFDIM